MGLSSAPAVRGKEYSFLVNTLGLSPIWIHEARVSYYKYLQTSFYQYQYLQWIRQYLQSIEAI